MSAQYFAHIDDNNVVTRVAVVQRDFLEANPERYSGTWVETFIGVEGKTYAGVGFIYHADADVFVVPQPFGSWSLDSNYDWQAPAPRPTDGKDYTWDEASLAWVVSPAL
jgi:hypothetical protein